MAASRWPLSEVVRRLCGQLNAPAPSSLTAAALADSQFHRDLIDAIYDATHRLILQLNPEELHATTVLRTVDVSNVNIVVTEGSADISWYSGGTGTASAASWAMPILCFNDYDGIYELTDIIGTTAMSATADRTIELPDGTYSGVIITRAVALPADYNALRGECWNITNAHNITVLSRRAIDEKVGSDTDIDILRLLPGDVRYVSIERDSNGAAYLMTYPTPDSAQDLRVPYIRGLDIYDATTDDADTTYFPLAPHHQHLILDAVVVELLGHQLQAGQENRAYYDAMKRLTESLANVDAELDLSRNETVVEPVTYSGRRRLFNNSRVRRLSPDEWERA